VFPFLLIWEFSYQDAHIAMRKVAAAESINCAWGLKCTWAISSYFAQVPWPLFAMIHSLANMDAGILGKPVGVQPHANRHEDIDPVTVSTHLSSTLDSENILHLARDRNSTWNMGCFRQHFPLHSNVFRLGQSSQGRTL
jgi:hypothetical protein